MTTERLIINDHLIDQSSDDNLDDGHDLFRTINSRDKSKDKDENLGMAFCETIDQNLETSRLSQNFIRTDKKIILTKYL